jgi:hypothetical protein
MDMVYSDLMWRLSKSGIGMPMFDMKAVANSKQKMKEVISNWKEGIPTEIDGSVVGGVQNAVMNVPGNLDGGFYNAWSILPQLKSIAEDASGIHADAMGENNDPKKLVGTTEIAIQQTNIMLRPFMDAQVDFFLQVNQCFAQAGIQFYRTMPWALSEMIGDEGTAAIMAMEENTLERFRVKQVVTFEAEAMKEKADQMAMAYLQMGLLDPESAAQCLGNSFPRDVDNAVRAYTKRAAKAAQQQQADAMKQQQMGMLMQQQQSLDMQQQQASAGLAQTAMDAEKVNQKAQAPLVQAAADHLAPQEQTEPQMQA